MKIRTIKLFICLVTFFIIGTFFLGLNKESIYNTKGLEGTNIGNIELDHFTEEELHWLSPISSDENGVFHLGCHPSRETNVHRSRQFPRCALDASKCSIF